MTTVQLFITCLLDTLYPETAAAVVQVLQYAGVEVAIPAGQTCCGQPAFNAGLRADARRMAMHTLRVLEAAPGAIIIPSGSCAAMVRCQYPELFADDPLWLPRAQAVAARVYELSEFLVDVLRVTDLGARYPGRLTYHSSCHLLRELGIDRQPRALLAAVREAQLVELPGTQECCGFGGVFSLEHAEISAAMLERKLANLAGTQADVLVACDAGCLTNIGGGLKRKQRRDPAKRPLPRVMHIAEVLARR